MATAQGRLDRRRHSLSPPPSPRSSSPFPFVITPFAIRRALPLVIRRPDRRIQQKGETTPGAGAASTVRWIRRLNRRMTWNRKPVDIKGSVMAGDARKGVDPIRLVGGFSPEFAHMIRRACPTSSPVLAAKKGRGAKDARPGPSHDSEDLRERVPSLPQVDTPAPPPGGAGPSSLRVSLMKRRISRDKRPVTDKNDFQRKRVMPSRVSFRLGTTRTSPVALVGL